MNLFSPDRVEHVVSEDSKREEVTRRARTKNLVRATPKNAGVSLYIIYIIFSRGRNPNLLFVARTRNQPTRHLAINRRENSKSSQYNIIEYEIILERRGSFMREHDDIDDDNKGEDIKTLCKNLLERD